MNIADDQLNSFVQAKSLVSIRRDEIDSRSIQAVPLQFSDDLLMVQYIYDFHVDGLLILKRTDITDISCGATDQFQKQLLTDSGTFDQINFALVADLSSFPALLQQQAGASIVILESEGLDDSDFWIGRHIQSDSDSICLHEFSGTGRWLDELTRISAADITCCQLNTNYIRFYADYFENHPPPEVAG